MTERLTQLRIQNYRCLRDVTIDFEPLTALVGPNASGKSSILYAMDPRKQLRQSDLFDPNDQRVLAELKSTSIDSSTEIGFGSALASRLPLLLRFQLLHLDVKRLRENVLLQLSTRLASDGSGVPNLLHSLSRAQQDDVAERLRKLVPIYSDVDTKAPESGQAGTHEIVFRDRWNSNRWFRPNDVSDGTMLLLALLLVPYQSPDVSIVGIEEPEHGIHPYLIENVVKMLRMLADGTLGPRPVQVILTTHSPTLLSFLDPKEVRFLRRDRETGGTIIEKAPIEAPNWNAAFESYERDLGAMWLSGALGGVTGAS